jgi:hypothetical protein
MANIDISSEAKKAARFAGELLALKRDLAGYEAHRQARGDIPELTRSALKRAKEAFAEFLGLAERTDARAEARRALDRVNQAGGDLLGLAMHGDRSPLIRAEIARVANELAQSCANADIHPPESNEELVSLSRRALVSHSIGARQ